MRRRSDPITFTRISILMLLLVVVLGIVILPRMFLDSERLIEPAEVISELSPHQQLIEPPVPDIPFMDDPVSPEPTVEFEEVSQNPAPRPVYSSLSGHVIDKDTGETIGGVMVRLTSEFLYRYEAPEDRDVLECRTNVEGAFRFENLRHTDFSIHVEDGRGFYEPLQRYKPLTIQTGQQVMGKTLLVEHCGVVMGHVYREETGESLANISVEIYLPGGGEQAASSLRTGKTGADGSYRFGGLKSGTYLVGLGEENMPADIESKRTASVVPGEVVHGIDFTLKGGLQLSGRVITPDGEIDRMTDGYRSAAHVTARTEDKQWNNYDCDPDGSFKIYGFAPGDQVILRAHPAYETNQLETTAGPFTIGFADLEGVEIELSRGSSVSGEVVDNAGNIIPFANVLIYAGSLLTGDSFQENTECDTNGKFSFVGLKARTYRILCSLRAKSIFVLGPESSPIGESISLTSAQNIEGYQLVYEDLPNKSIRGRVTYQSGAPAAGIIVIAMPASESRTGLDTVSLNRDYPSTKTNTNGKFELEGLFNGRYRIDLKKSYEMNSNTLGGKTAQAGDTNVYIEINVPAEEKHRTIIGQVLDARTGDAIPVFGIVTSGSAFMDATELLRYQSITHYDQEGCFSVEHEGLGETVIVTAYAKGYIATQKRLDGSWSHDSVREVTIQMEPAQVITGRVVSDDGKPIAGARFAAGDHASNWSTIQESFTRSDAEGEFILNTLPREPVEVWIIHPDYAPVSMVIDGRSPSGNLNITLPRYGRLEGFVLCEGKPVSGVTVTVDPGISEGGQYRFRHSSDKEKGFYAITTLPPGTYPVRISNIAIAAEYVSNNQYVSIQPGKVTRFDVYLKPTTD